MVRSYFDGSVEIAGRGTEDKTGEIHQRYGRVEHWASSPYRRIDLVDILDLCWDDQELKLHCCEISLICAMLGIHLSDSQQAEQ